MEKTKLIKISKGRKTLVDENDYNYLSQWRWNFDTRGYASRVSTKMERHVIY